MRKKSIITGVTGSSGGGGTSVPKAILTNFKDQKIAIIQHDSCYKGRSHLTFEEHMSANYDHSLTFDTGLMIEHIDELIARCPVGIPIYDYIQHTRSEKTYCQEPQDVFIVERILVLEDKRLRDLMNIKLFVDASDDIRIIRRIRRDMEERGRSLGNVIGQYTSIVEPMYHQFIEPTKRYADIIIPGGASNVVVISLINTRITTILE